MSGLIFSLVESPSHPVYTNLYHSLGFKEQRFNSMRKAISALKKEKPDYVVGEFFYGYGNNYAGANLSNLDVFLHSLNKYAPMAKIIVLVSRHEAVHVDKLKALFDIHAVLIQPVSNDMMAAALGN